MKRFVDRIRLLIHDRRGVAYIEFALAFPFMLLLFGGTMDLTRMVLLHQKLDKATFTVGDLTTQLERSNNTCNVISGWEDTVVRDMLLPFSYKSDGYWFMVTSIIGNSNGTRDVMEWRYNSGAGNSKLGGYAYGKDIRSALPTTLRGLGVDERVIVTEMGYNFEPIFPTISRIVGQPFRKISYFRSRITTGNESLGSGNLSGC
jgi:hypothetical protein